ncbi:MAG: hypothetical protein R3314_03975 [Longimicrobiales bacterium]|nr:hypothetical protein [Longimicrobiales bacterium]
MKRYVPSFLLLAALVASPLAGQASSPLDRILDLDVDRVEVGRVDVVYSAHQDADSVTTAVAARAAAGPFADAAGYFAQELGGDLQVTLALLSPRDWHRVRAGMHAIPWSWQPSRLVVLPVRSDLGLLQQGGQDSARAGRVLEVVGLHQLGHVVAAAYYHPYDYRAPHPPVRWFDELLASYLSHAYMRARRPGLAEFVEELALDVVMTAEPRFSSLSQYDRYYDGYLSSPSGATNLGWYQNAFNLQAVRLYDRYGPELMHRLRDELPWDRIEGWTTDELLDALQEIAPGFASWAEEMAAYTGAPRR